MIIFSNVTKRFGKFLALEDLALEVLSKEAVALWGPNGAGKTTAIKCLLDLLKYEGQITGTFEFDAVNDGTYAYYCTEFCSALHLEMMGYLLIEP